MTNITLNHKNGTIELTKSFSNASSKYGSEAYNQLQQVRRDYPTYQIVTASSKAGSGKRDTLADINKDLKHLQNAGYKYIFIDEVTLMADFIEGAALFSDIYAACGMKIVLSGTDSLGFLFSEDDQLYDRYYQVHTTHIPYREFEEILGIKGIDEYIRYGGTMSMGGVNYNETATFASKKNADEYVDSAYSIDFKTLFDMGCGPGTLAIPFAQKGHEVFAADFSSFVSPPAESVNIS